MPFTSPDDVPARVKAFFRNIGASEKDKRQWVEVFNSCMERFSDDSRCFRMANGVLSKKHKGDFVESSINEVSLTRLETEWGSVWQIPAVMTREGVQNGFLKDFEEIKATAWTANFIPVTDGHPKEEHNGRFLGARTNIEFIRGFVTNPKADETSRSLKATINIFAEERNKWLIEDIMSGRKIDGSVGFYTDEVQANGSFNDQKYEGLEINIVYDHFAILPKGHGACSIKDGCGLGLNMSENAETKTPPGFSAVTECLQTHLREAWSVSTPAEIMRHLMLAMECVKKDGSSTENKKKTLDEKKEIVQAELEMFGFDESDIREMDLDYDALFYMVDCDTCSGSTLPFDEAVWGDVQYTFSPPWSSIDKTGFPASSFMVVSDPEKKVTWKLPYKVGGKVHCGAIRAIRQVLAGARGGVKLSPEDRGKAKRLADRHWAACQRIKERADEIDWEGHKDFVEFGKPDLWHVQTLKEGENLTKKVLYIDEDINKVIDMAETALETQLPKEPEKDKGKEDALKVLGDALESLKTERDALRVQVIDMEKLIKDFKDKDEAASRRALTDLRNRVLNLNIAYKVWEYDHILRMDEEDLKGAERLLTHFVGKGKKSGFTSGEPSIYTIPGSVPLSIGNMYKASKKEKGD